MIIFYQRKLPTLWCVYSVAQWRSQTSVDGGGHVNQMKPVTGQ